MVIQKSKKSMIYFIPECSCNKKVSYIKWKSIRSNSQLIKEQMQWAVDHEELHSLSDEIMNFITKTGKMQKEEIVENFPDYNESQISIAANLVLYPIVFPKKRHAPFTEFRKLKTLAYEITSQYRRAKYEEE